jgi:long-chain acyl-CoA synthetase
MRHLGKIETRVKAVRVYRADRLFVVKFSLVVCDRFGPGHDRDGLCYRVADPRPGDRAALAAAVGCRPARANQDSALPMQTLKPIIRSLLCSPTRIVVVDDQRSWKAYELYVAALHMARAIARTTDRPNVGVMVPTSGLFPAALIASWMLGRTVVPLNYLLKGSELEYVIDDAELDAIVTVKPMVDFIGGLPKRVRQVRFEDVGFRGFPPLRLSASRPDDHVAVLLYTSGTSGKPKGVMLTAKNLASNVRQCVEWADFTRADVLLGVLPQFHSFGLTVLTILPLSVGCKAVYMARFAPRKLLELMREHRPTALIAIPSMYAALLHSKGTAADDFASLKYIVSGGEPLPAAVFDGFREKFNVTLNEGYGLTETSPVTNWCRPQDHKRKSVGQALSGVEEIIVAPDGRRLGRNEDGEVRIKGPNVMKGYYKLPDLTAQVFDAQGYFKTGDMGRIDDDGHLYITGRIKEMLIIGGENVFPREIEEVLNQHPSVAASAVIGVMDESRGETPVAFVELQEGAAFDETAIRGFCRERIAQFKVPREVRLLDKLPRNATGKIMRRELKADTPSIAPATARAT